MMNLLISRIWKSCGALVSLFVNSKKPATALLTPREEFIRLLGESSFGKIICINLFRSARLKTLNDNPIRDFLDKCVAQHGGQMLINPTETPSKMALIVATQWTTRSSLVSTNEFPSPASTIEPIQFATVINCEEVERSAAAIKVATFGPRKLTTQSEFHSVIKEWVKCGDTWTFGKGRNYFWLARPVDSSQMTDSRNAHGFARFHRDTLGLCHYGKVHRLVRVLIPASLAISTMPLLRPTAFDGIDNPAFLAATDKEIFAPASQPGTTLDLHFRSDPASILGQHEWLSKPLTVAAGAVVWDFLGSPGDSALSADPIFHKDVLSMLSRETPIEHANSYLNGLT
jgi:hypothetical protein